MVVDSGLPNIPKGAYSPHGQSLENHCQEHMRGGPPQQQYFLVAMSDQFAALSALRKRPTLRNADLTVVGEASPDDVELLDVKDGEIFCVIPIFETRFSKQHTTS